MSMNLTKLNDDDLIDVYPSLLNLGSIGLCFYLGFTMENNISDSLFYKIVFFIWLVWLLIYLPFALYEGIKYYFTDLHKYNQEAELNAETKEIREYIKLRGGR